MTSFAKERQYGTFGTLDKMNYAINFYHDATVLSIVCDSSPHGTHVAGITASAASAGATASADRNGVAPGAELIGFVIGDVRLGTMETGAALARAMAEAVRLKCDIVNLSFGEGSCVSNAGRFVELAEELVWKHNVCFVASAGNDGVSDSLYDASNVNNSVATHPSCAHASFRLNSCASPACFDNRQGTGRDVIRYHRRRCVRFPGNDESRIQPAPERRNLKGWISNSRARRRKIYRDNFHLEQRWAVSLVSPVGCSPTCSCLHMTCALLCAL